MWEIALPTPLRVDATVDLLGILGNEGADSNALLGRRLECRLGITFFCIVNVTQSIWSLNI